jgi:hypothetical protein
MVAAMLKPPTMPILLLRYNPELATAIWPGSTPAFSMINEIESATPFPNPPPMIYRDSKKEVCPCQRSIRSR